MEKIVPKVKLTQDSPVPLHFQLSEGIVDYLSAHPFPPGTSLVSERTLADSLDLSRNTVRRAYSDLFAKKVFERKSGGRRIYLTEDFVNSRALQSYPTIGLVLSSKVGEIMRQGEFMPLEYVSGVIDTAADLGFSTTVISLPPEQEPREKLDIWFKNMRQHLCGLIYQGDAKNQYHNTAFEIMLSESSIPQVSMGGVSQHPHLLSVKADACVGFVAAVNHLVTLGHTQLGMVFEHVPQRQYMQTQSYTRYNDAQKALYEAGIAVPGKWILRDFDDEQTLSQALLRVYQSDHGPTALLCCNDKVARNTIRILSSIGYHVPGDISVVGYDDNQIARSEDPEITSIMHPRSQLGASAVKLIKKIRTKSEQQSTPCIVPTALVVRASTAPVKD